MTNTVQVSSLQNTSIFYSLAEKTKSSNIGSVTLVNSIGNDSTIVNAARVSFNKVSNTFSEKDRKLLKYLIENKHETPLEMVDFTFSVYAPLFVVRQWMRHRMASYNEVSRRYTSEDIHFFNPSPFQIREQDKKNKQASTLFSTGKVENQLQASNLIKEHTERSLILYENLLELGVAREQARMVLPQNLMTRFLYKTNLRSLHNFLSLRDSEHAQEEIQWFAQSIKKLIKPIIPITYSLLYGEA